MPKSTHSAQPSTRPEHKIGPYPGGIGVAIWTNTIRTENGPRKIRSVTISPRRYRDADSGEWRDATSFRAGDLPALIFALTKAQEYMYTTPIPGQKEQEDQEEIPY